MARKWRYFRNQDCDESVPQSGCLKGPKDTVGMANPASQDSGDTGHHILCKGMHSLIAFTAEKARKLKDLGKLGFPVMALDLLCKQVGVCRSSQNLAVKVG